MTESSQINHASFILPTSLISVLDLARLINDFEQLDSELTTLAVRSKVKAGTANSVEVPERLQEFLQFNGISTDESSERSRLIRELRKLKDIAPVMHLTFAVEADRESLAKIVAWMRSEINPQTVIEVGLQPGLVAGVSLRTPNKVHDMSLKKALATQHETLVKQLEAYGGGV